jgi:hypothetical protein
MPARNPTSQGYLIPANHTAYWMGLVAATRTQWRWLEPAVPSLSGPGKVYTNWGMSPDGRPEPNNRQPPEDCGAANMTQLANGAGGWADANCQVKLPFICKMIRERRRNLWCQCRVAYIAACCQVQGKVAHASW